jgi:hypothetical protein
MTCTPATTRWAAPVTGPDGIAKAFGIAPALVQEIEFMNDDDFCYRRVTDEERYHCMRVWVEAQITP